MIITSNLDSPDDVPVSPPGTLCAAAIDVEWSKNYRLRGGNVPFCYSVTWLVLSPEHVWPGTAGFWYTSAYVQDASYSGGFESERSTGCVASTSSRCDSMLPSRSRRRPIRSAM